MGQKAISVTRLAATALLVSVAVLGCATHNRTGAGAGQPAVSVPAAGPSQVVETAPTLTPTLTPTPAAASDSIDSQLSDLEKQLNGINGSLSGGDAGPSSGE
jgi:hypothetical protein